MAGWMRWVVLVGIASTTLSAQEASKEDEKTVDEWIADLQGSFRERQAATRSLAKIGAPAVPPLLKLFKERKAMMGQAMQVFAKMGPAARPALAALVEVIEADIPNPEGWTWSATPRELALSEVGSMEWAAGELVPILYRIAASTEEDTGARRRATLSLGGMGPSGVAALKKLIRGDSVEVRRMAHLKLAEAFPEGQKEYFSQLLEQDPCDPSANTYLSHVKGVINAGVLDPLTERVKSGLRVCLRERPDPELAMTLARILSDQLANTALCWASPVDGVRSMWARENPKESFHSLREVLELGFEASEEGTTLRREFGDALARLALLLGDWDGMNRALVAIGEEPIAVEKRPWLSAPPTEWKGIGSAWQEADKEVRSGSASLVVECEKDGQPLQGVHVLIKELPPPPKAESRRVFRSGIRADTLFLRTQPLPRLGGGFGYQGQDRSRTRYGVTDEKGIVRLSGLRAVPVKLEVLVPTSNFHEAGAEWELWMEVSPGAFRVASNRPGPNTQSSAEPPGQVVLVDGETTRYPKLIVRPRTGLNINDYARVDPETFSLTWGASVPADAGADWQYDVELGLSAPADDPSFLPSTPTLRSGKERVRDKRFPISERGVGGVRLVPGNFYWVQVTALGENDRVAFRSTKTRFWVPWSHRKSQKPMSGFHRGERETVPISHGKWWRGSSTYGDGTKENLRQRVERFLKTRREAFEYEYVLLGEAWLDWRDGDAAKARAALERLMKPLPEGNVVRATAAMLLDRLTSDKSCPKRLNFVGP